MDQQVRVSGEILIHLRHLGEKERTHQKRLTDLTSQIKQAEDTRRTTIIVTALLVSLVTVASLYFLATSGYSAATLPVMFYVGVALAVADGIGLALGGYMIYSATKEIKRKKDEEELARIHREPAEQYSMGQVLEGMQEATPEAIGDVLCKFDEADEEEGQFFGFIQEVDKSYCRNGVKVGANSAVFGQIAQAGEKLTGLTHEQALQLSPDFHREMIARDVLMPALQSDDVLEIMDAPETTADQCEQALNLMDDNMYQACIQSLSQKQPPSDEIIQAVARNPERLLNRFEAEVFQQHDFAVALLKHLNPQTVAGDEATYGPLMIALLLSVDPSQPADVVEIAKHPVYVAIVLAKTIKDNVKEYFPAWLWSVCRRMSKEGIRSFARKAAEVLNQGFLESSQQVDNYLGALIPLLGTYPADHLPQEFIQACAQREKCVANIIINHPKGLLLGDLIDEFYSKLNYKNAFVCMLSKKIENEAAGKNEEEFVELINTYPKNEPILRAIGKQRKRIGEVIVKLDGETPSPIDQVVTFYMTAQDLDAMVRSMVEYRSVGIKSMREDDVKTMIQGMLERLEKVNDITLIRSGGFRYLVSKDKDNGLYERRLETLLAGMDSPPEEEARVAAAFRALQRGNRYQVLKAKDPQKWETFERETNPYMQQ